MYVNREVLVFQNLSTFFSKNCITNMIQLCFISTTRTAIPKLKTLPNRNYFYVCVHQFSIIKNRSKYSNMLIFFYARFKSSFKLTRRFQEVVFFQIEFQHGINTYVVYFCTIMTRGCFNRTRLIPLIIFKKNESVPTYVI